MHYTDSSMTVPVFGIWQDAVIFIWHAKVLIAYAMHGDSRYTWTNIITKNNRLYWSVISRCHKNRSQLWLIVIAIQCIFYFFFWQIGLEKIRIDNLSQNDDERRCTTVSVLLTVRTSLMIHKFTFMFYVWSCPDWLLQDILVFVSIFPLFGCYVGLFLSSF